MVESGKQRKRKKSHFDGSKKKYQKNKRIAKIDASVGDVSSLSERNLSPYLKLLSVRGKCRSKSNSKLWASTSTNGLVNLKDLVGSYISHEKLRFVFKYSVFLSNLSIITREN